MLPNAVNIINEKLSDFHQQGVPALFKRDLDLGRPAKPAKGNLVQVIVGMRRCGKTYRLYQEIQRIIDDGTPIESILYFNFDDERLKPYESALLDQVLQEYYARFPEAKTKGAYFFFDEIQEVPDWGTFLRRMVDTQKATVYVTGSSSKMLSSEIATEFRGRAISREMFPMSFSEFLRFRNVKPAVQSEQNAGHFSSAQKARLRKELGCYLQKGGFIATQQLETSDAIQLLQEYANRTVNFDVIERYQVSNPQAASLFLARAVACSGRELSINKIANDMKSRGISVARETLSRLISYYEKAFLLFSVKEYSVALADNPRATSKIYAADPALFGAFSPAGATDDGQRLETACFNKLRREIPSIRSNAISRALIHEENNSYEVDFVVGDALLEETPKLVQVCVALHDNKTRKREIKGMQAAMKRFSVGEGTLVTMNDEEVIEVECGTIQVVPAWKWLI